MTTPLINLYDDNSPNTLDLSGSGYFKRILLDMYNYNNISIDYINNINTLNFNTQFIDSYINISDYKGIIVKELYNTDKSKSISIDDLILNNSSSSNNITLINDIINVISENGLSNLSFPLFNSSETNPSIQYTLNNYFNKIVTLDEKNIDNTSIYDYNIDLIKQGGDFLIFLSDNSTYFYGINSNNLTNIPYKPCTNNCSGYEFQTNINLSGEIYLKGNSVPQNLIKNAINFNIRNYTDNCIGSFINWPGQQINVQITNNSQNNIFINGNFLSPSNIIYSNNLQYSDYNNNLLPKIIPKFNLLTKNKSTDYSKYYGLCLTNEINNKYYYNDKPLDDYVKIDFCKKCSMCNNIKTPLILDLNINDDITLNKNNVINNLNYTYCLKKSIIKTNTVPLQTLQYPIHIQMSLFGEIQTYLGNTIECIINQGQLDFDAIFNNIPYSYLTFRIFEVLNTYILMPVIIVIDNYYEQYYWYYNNSSIFITATINNQTITDKICLGMNIIPKSLHYKNILQQFNTSSVGGIPDIYQSIVLFKQFYGNVNNALNIRITYTIIPKEELLCIIPVYWNDASGKINNKLSQISLYGFWNNILYNIFDHDYNNYINTGTYSSPNFSLDTNIIKNTQSYLVYLNNNIYDTIYSYILLNNEISLFNNIFLKKNFSQSSNPSFLLNIPLFITDNCLSLNTVQTENTGISVWGFLNNQNINKYWENYLISEDYLDNNGNNYLYDITLPTLSNITGLNAAIYIISVKQILYIKILLNNEIIEYLLLINNNLINIASITTIVISNIYNENNDTNNTLYINKDILCFKYYNNKLFYGKLLNEIYSLYNNEVSIQLSYIQNINNSINSEFNTELNISSNDYYISGLIDTVKNNISFKDTISFGNLTIPNNSDNNSIIKCIYTKSKMYLLYNNIIYNIKLSSNNIYEPNQNITSFLNNNLLVPIKGNINHKLYFIKNIYSKTGTLNNSIIKEIYSSNIIFNKSNSQYNIQYISIQYNDNMNIKQYITIYNAQMLLVDDNIQIIYTINNIQNTITLNDNSVSNSSIQNTTLSYNYISSCPWNNDIYIIQYNKLLPP